MLSVFYLGNRGGSLWGALDAARDGVSRKVISPGWGEGNDLAEVAFFPPWILPILTSRDESTAKDEPYPGIVPFLSLTSMANNAVCYTFGECKLFLRYLI